MKRLIIILLLITSVSYSQVRKISLSDWNFKNTKDAEWHKATVPGTIHTDLLENKLIEDPFYGTNELSLQWIEKDNWEYVTTFTVNEEQLNDDCEIVFEGLDTYADVFVNDKKLFTADNMFLEWINPCKEFLKRGENTIRVLFYSPVKIEDSLASVFSKQTGIENMFGGNRVFTRKAAYHYGWDWSPRFVTCGIWRPAYIRFLKSGKINDVESIQNITNGKAEITFNVNCSGAAGLELVLCEKESGKEIVKTDIKNPDTELKTEILNPELWWTNGLGDAHLYKYKIILRDGKTIVDEKSMNIGLRTIELIQDKDSAGSTFYFKLNGIPVFMKGANFIPPDNFLPRVTKDKYSQLVKDAVNSNMNMLRVWGGGVYEDDEFYNLCDENGILVWQDFMFACSMVPPGETFRDNVYKEAIYNIKRLRNHPCIALWCGNNESDEGWKNWGWQNELSNEQKSIMWSAYENIFNTVLPSAVSEFHKNSNYISSSPKIGWGHKESMTEGDSHYWGVWWGMEPFEVYNNKVGRFVSEYGFQGFPNVTTLKNIMPGEELYLYSNSLKAHQKHPTGFETIQKYMEMYYNIPDIFSKYVSISQNLQAEGIKLAIEAHRRAKPYCMGTLYWQFNDCNPVISWSGIDYYGGWKKMQEFVKQAYADILVSPVEEYGKLRVYIVSDRLKDTKGILEINIQPFTGILQGEKYLSSVEIKANSSEVFFEKNLKDVYKSTDKYTDYLTVTLKTDDGKYYTNEYLFCKPKEIKIVK
jgi:beta-mannosidase